MTSHEEQALDELMQLVGRELEAGDDALRWQDEWFLQWLAADVRAERSRSERERDAGDAAAFAARVVARHDVARAMRRLPRRQASYRRAAVGTTIGEAVPLARAAGCAAVLDLAAAAGAGRELWDDPCESWLELPADLPPGKHVAIHVEGDSMEPVLTSGDVIVIKLDAVPAVNDLVVARRPSSGFVVKRLASITPRQIELASLNPAYPSFTMRRAPTSIIGTVVARFSRSA